MPKARVSLSPIALLIEAWNFFQKQPALAHVLLWFLIVPPVVLDVLEVYWPQGETQSVEQIGQAAYGLAQVIVAVVSFWGFACVLLVGRRMVKSMAGRSRTSFKSVRRESIRMIVPLFFTSLLRAIVTFEWALLAIIPAVLFLFGNPACRVTFGPLLAMLQSVSIDPTTEAVLEQVKAFVIGCGPSALALPLFIFAVAYQIRTVFYGVVIASEDLRYRDALRRSRDVVRGRTWSVFFTIIALGVLVSIPAFVVYMGMNILINITIPQLPVLTVVIDEIVSAIAGLLFTLALIALYAKLSKQKGRVQEVIPDDL